MKQLVDPAFVMKRYDKRTANLAIQLGWRIIQPGQGLKDILRILPDIIRADYILVADVAWPFISGKSWEKTLREMEREDLLLFFCKNACGMSPPAIMNKTHAILGTVVYFLFLKKKPWTDVVRMVAPAKKQRVLLMDPPGISSHLQTDSVTTEIVENLGGVDFDPGDPAVKDRNHFYDTSQLTQFARDRLAGLLVNSKLPHRTNRKLMRFEFQHGLSLVKAFPTDVAINISDRCNAACLFCNYEKGQSRDREYMSLADIKMMTWLKYVSKIGLGGGVGEPLCNPEFSDIFQYIKKRFPHLTSRLITNGILLNENICQALCGSLSRIRISLNAASPGTWENLMRTTGFQRVCRQIAFLSDLKLKIGTRLPEIILLMVVNKRNIHEAEAFAELAHRLGAQAVGYYLFSKSIMQDSDMPIEDSVYFNQEKADRWLKNAERKAKMLGITVYAKPLPFKHETFQYFQGDRVVAAPVLCRHPWSTAYLTKGQHTDRPYRLGFCCGGNESRIQFNRSELSEHEFVKLWNHPHIRKVRDTVNSASPQAICRFCRTVDQNDPVNLDICRQMHFKPFSNRVT